MYGAGLCHTIYNYRTFPAIEKCSNALYLMEEKLLGDAEPGYSCTYSLLPRRIRFALVPLMWIPLPPSPTSLYYIGVFKM